MSRTIIKPIIRQSYFHNGNSNTGKTDCSRTHWSSMACLHCTVHIQFWASILGLASDPGIWMVTTVSISHSIFPVTECMWSNIWLWWLGKWNLWLVKNKLNSKVVYKLTQWPLERRGSNFKSIIFKVWWALTTKLLWDECHRSSLIRSQHLFR